MAYAAIAAIAGWLIYAWEIGVTLGLVCGLIALFYAGALEGMAQEKVVKTFSWLVLAMTILLVGVMSSTTTVYDEDAPKMCNHVQC